MFRRLAGAADEEVGGVASGNRKYMRERQDGGSIHGRYSGL